MSNQGKLIVIDGIDGSGKSTQANLLVKRLIAEGHPAARITFPRYDTFLGKTIRAYLHGELGPPDQQSPYLVSLLFASDRRAACDELIATLEHGTSVVLDRYVASNSCFQAARLPARQRADFRSWLEELEYDVFGLPRADQFLYLSVPTTVAGSLIDRRGQPREAYERDQVLIRRVRTEYTRYCQTTGQATLVRCAPRGTLLTIDQIHEKIWGVVQSLLKQ